MKKILEKIVVNFLLLSFAMAGCAALQAKPKPSDYTYTDHLMINSSALGLPGIQIAANMYVPHGKGKQTFPALIMPNSWGLNQYEYRKLAQQFAEDGYVVLSYSARGWGKSGGKVGAGGQEDMADIHNIIDWIINHAPVDPKRIGMVGISYGGGLSLLGAEHDARIRAVASLSGWTNLYDSLYYAQTPSIMSAQILMLSAKLKHAGLSTQLISLMQDFSTYHMSVADKAWAFAHSAISYVNALNVNKTAVLLSTNLQDKLFNPEDTYNFYQRLSVPHKLLLLNQGVHGSAESTGLQGKPNRVWNEVKLWFDQYLKNKTVNVKSGVYVQFPEKEKYQPLKFQQATATKLYLSAMKPGYYGTLNSKPLTVNQEVNSIQEGSSGMNSGTSRFTFIELWRLRKALMQGTVSPVSMRLSSLNTRYNLFYMNALPSKVMTIIGQPTVSLWIKIKGGKQVQKSSPVIGQLIGYLYDVDYATKRARLISLAPITYYKTTTPLNKWQKTMITFHLTAYHLPQGHVLALGIGTQDHLYKSAADSWGQNRILVRYFPEISFLNLPLQS